ncbi:N-methyl-L-tryptophan oxidase [Lactobacillus sp. Sy-1]|uniref:N-methyl-L-tryptophan oxidase n=1 Tax=Lactobacillus sp. Sy-1 TaxID=2109645 RepID=UPI001C5AE2C6|nr:N-methyl-L-tryptophan oxidase [Lactobacillus sp. Sy-1]MBW1606100.1 N-methyl-L-tryptophan oxidase [Lactobacillus sp. Sy-1]
MGKVYDLAIIGTGSVGSAAGYYASQDGLKVLELDLARPPHDQGSHHGQTRIIRHAYGEGAKYLPLVLRAQQLWESLQSQSRGDIFHQVGVLNVGPQNTEFITNVAKTAAEYQLPVDHLTASEINARWPDWHFDDDYRGIFERDSGYLLSENAIRAYIAGAEQNGVTQDFTAKVQSVKQVETNLVEIKTTNNTYFAHQVAVTAGTWVKELLPDLPIQPLRKVFGWFKVKDANLNESAGFSCFSVEDKTGEIYYGFPGKDGLIKIGHHNGGQPINQREGRLPYGEYDSDEHDVDLLFSEHLSGTAGLYHGAACTYDLSPDEDFIIDRVPGQPNIQVITGLSGHGFKFASVLGEIVVKRAQNRDVEFDLTPFRIDRF